MIRIGRYGLFFSRTFWTQAQVPVKVRWCLFFCVLREARPTDVDKHKQFKLGTPMVYGGRVHHYFRFGRPK